MFHLSMKLVALAHHRSQDILHSVHQGIACVLIASLVCAHLESKKPSITLKELDEALSKDVYKYYRAWCSNKGALVTGCSHRFSAARFGKEKWADCPELGSVYKAAVVKSMMFWCADFLKERDMGITDGDLRVHTMHAFAKFQLLIDQNGPFFDPDTTKQVVKVCRRGLVLYQQLAGIDKQRTDGRRSYKITPKFHSVLELTIYIQESNRNPRFEHCYQDEDLMKQISKISSMTHPATLEKVTLERYRALMQFFVLAATDPES